MTERIEESYRFALESGHAALLRNTGANTDSKRSLIEAVWWIAAADGYLQEAFGPKWQDYKDHHKPADLLSGIYWARNRAIHDPLSLATLTEESTAYSATYTSVYSNWAWAPLEEIAKVDPERDRGDGSAKYESALAGRLIVNTLVEGLQTLDELDLADLTDPG